MLPPTRVFAFRLLTFIVASAILVCGEKLGKEIVVNSVSGAGYDNNSIARL